MKKNLIRIAVIAAAVGVSLAAPAATVLAVGPRIW